MREMFEKCDTSQDGVLTSDELRDGLEGVLGALQVEAADWKELMEQMDTNGDGLVDYEEFIGAAVNREKLINDRNLKMLFETFDADGNGLITPDELKKAFQGYEMVDDPDGEQIWEEIMREVDKNGDNAISPEEFNEVMVSILEK